ncbi:MAG: hypothetical protein M1822_004798 [Bathelium mastoideum]|nr:MAG: hypothetical protein M1822_004798 [Bathelium mastoideum]
MAAMATFPSNRNVDQDQLSTSRGKALFALGIILPVLTTFFVAVRLYSRHMKRPGNNVYLNRARYGADDWLLIAALIFYYTLTAVLFIMVYPAWDGHHTLAVPNPVLALKHSVQAGFYGTLSYALVATCVRCSTCVLFVRIFIQRSYRIAAFINLSFNICWGIYSLLITIFQCTPVSKVLDSTVPGHCLNQQNLLLSLTIWGVVCDAITWTLPVPMVWGLHAPLSTKIGSTAVLGLGLVAIAIGGLRIWTVATITFEDPLWNLPLATYWAYTETGIGIVCAAAAAIAPAFQRFLISPSKKAYKHLHSWVSSQSDIDHNSNLDDKDPLSAATDKCKSEWSLGSNTKGSNEVSVQVLKHARTANAHPDEVTMCTEVSVIREA